MSCTPSHMRTIVHKYLDSDNSGTHAGEAIEYNNNYDALFNF